MSKKPKGTGDSKDPELKKTIPEDFWNQIQASLEGAFEDLSLKFFESIESIPFFDNEEVPEKHLPYLFISHQEILEKALLHLYQSLPRSQHIDFDLFKEVITSILKKPS